MLTYPQPQDRKLVRKLDWQLMPWVRLNPNFPRAIASR